MQGYAWRLKLEYTLLLGRCAGLREGRERPPAVISSVLDMADDTGACRCRLSGVKGRFPEPAPHEGDVVREDGRELCSEVLHGRQGVIH